MLSGNKKYIFSQISAVSTGVRSSQQDDVILWVVALRETCEITKHGRHLGFHQELEIR